MSSEGIASLKFSSSLETLSYEEIAKRFMWLYSPDKDTPDRLRFL